MRRLATIAPLCIAAWMACLGSARADGGRVALAVGVSACAGQPPLTKAAGDARAIAEMFRTAGFESVRTLIDPRRADLSDELVQFAQMAGGADIAVVFYAGCGMEVGGETYLIPADARLAGPEDVPAAVPMEDVLRALKPAARLGLVLYDASRTDPFAPGMKHRIPRGISAGPGEAEPRTTDLLIAYATMAMSEASDGDGAHSPFTAALLADLMVPGLDIRLALNRVRDDVLRATNRMQVPSVYGSIGGGSVTLLPRPRP